MDGLTARLSHRGGRISLDRCLKVTYPVAPCLPSRTSPRTGILRRTAGTGTHGRVFALPPQRVPDQLGGEVLRRRLRVGVAAREQQRVRRGAALVLPQSLGFLLGPAIISLVV